MTTATTTSWTTTEPTGRSALALLLTDTNQLRRDRCLWALLHRAFPAAVKQLSRVDGVLAGSLHPHPELSDQGRHQLRVNRRGIAEDLYESLARDLWHTRRTLTALAGGSGTPIHADERACLTRAITRSLNRHGALTDDITARRLTDAALSELAHALDLLIL